MNIRQRFVSSCAAVSTLALAFAGVTSCGANFDPKNKVAAVRILAASADHPYARPNEAVRIQALAHDGRTTPRDPMRIYWFPAPCVNPPADQYFACYALFDAIYPPNVDLTPVLHEGNETSITIPADALTTAVTRPGQAETYATAYVFMVACAGHVERVGRKPGLAINALPLACKDANGVELPPDDWVVGFTRVFVFESRRNSIPVVAHLTLDGAPVDPNVGVVTKCEKDAKSNECRKPELDVVFDDAIAEVDPDNVDLDGKVGRETIFVDWFTTAGKFVVDRKIVFDGNLGRPKKPANELELAVEPSRGTIWAVVHDNRGGTSWITVPLDVRP